MGGSGSRYNDNDDDTTNLAATKTRRQRRSIHPKSIAPVVVAAPAAAAVSLVSLSQVATTPWWYGMSWRKETHKWFYLSCVMLFWMKPVKGGNGFRPFFFLSNLAGLKRGRNHRAENNRPWLSTFDSLMHWSISFSIDCRMKCTNASKNQNSRVGRFVRWPKLPPAYYRV